jgi:hypothetical protein
VVSKRVLNITIILGVTPAQNNKSYCCTDNACGDADEEREVNDVFEEPGDKEHYDDEDQK